MKKIIKLTESDLQRIIKRVIKEDSEESKAQMLISKGSEILDSESKKKRFKQLCLECIDEIEKKEPGFSKDMRVSEVLTGYSLLFIAGAAFLNFFIVVVPAVAAFAMIGNEVRKKWKRVLECVKGKKQALIALKSMGAEKNPEQSDSIQEQNIKKILRRLF